MSRSRAWYRDVGRALPAPDAAHSARPALLEPPADTVRPWAVGNWPVGSVLRLTRRSSWTPSPPPI